jgi:hypothetical protein
MFRSFRALESIVTPSTATPSEKPLPFHKMTERHQRADAIADDLGDREHRR